MDRTECKYGTKCYRKQKTHFVEHSHPFVEEIAARIHKGEIEEVISLGLEPVLLEQVQVVAELIESNEIQVNSAKGQKRSSTADDEEHQLKKKIKLSASSESASSSSSKSVVEKIIGATPLSFFLSTIASIPETRDESSISFADLLDPSLGILAESAQFNFMVDVGWLLSQYCQHKVQRKPMVIFYGVESEELESVPKKVPTLKTFRVKPKYPFGSHHTKMALFSYEDKSLRIVVHTGNLIESDWEDRTQGLWISPSCPPVSSDDDTEGPDSETGFKRDLLRYLSAYGLSALDPWMDKIRRCDMSSINVCFLPSVPGSHLGADPMKWGHSHLAQLLQKHNKELDCSQIVMQCSSIGSLGPNPNSWLAGELAQSMSNPSKSPAPNFKVIYPCYQDVESSLHGLAGGGCLPYSRQGHSKQMWFSSFLNKWRSDKQLRTKAMPHIKSYARISSDFSRASWFVLTSANLSKAAWGMKTNKGTSLMIQSFEAGVLFLPKFINKGTSFELHRELVLPYDLPLTPYDSQDEPWFIDQLR